MNGALFASRVATLSFGVLGLMGAILSITGIFGMAAYSVSRRLKKLGIRVALGAQRKKVLRRSLEYRSGQSVQARPRAYTMAMSGFGLRKEEIAFAAFGGWDAAGAKWFGYPTFWVNRVDAAAEELGVAPDAVGKDLNDLAVFVRNRPK